MKFFNKSRESNGCQQLKWIATNHHPGTFLECRNSEAFYETSETISCPAAITVRVTAQQQIHCATNLRNVTNDKRRFHGKMDILAIISYFPCSGVLENSGYKRERKFWNNRLINPLFAVELGHQR